MNSTQRRIRSTTAAGMALVSSLVTLSAVQAADGGKPAFAGTLKVDGLVGYQIAAKPLVDNPTSFAIDEKGQFYVVESPRLRAGLILDIRNERQFTLQDFTLKTVDERRQMLLSDTKSKKKYAGVSERVVKLVDANGDGKPDQRHDYAVDGMGEAEDGLAFSALAYDNQVFVTCIPHVWRFADLDGDHKAEVREKLLSGFGVGISMMGHDMHGIVRGPDGRLYWSIGDRGFNVVSKEGVRFTATNSGAIFRCEPDGSNMEIFFHGLRNPQEIAFDEFGNLMTFDNTGDFGDIARVVYAQEGGDAGWSKEHHAPHQYKWAFPDKELMTNKSRWIEDNMFRPAMDDQPQWTLPPIMNFENGPSGIVYVPGESLPESLSGSFLVTNYRGDAKNCTLLSFKFDVDGASFAPRKKDPQVVLSGIGSSDVDIGYDGRLYLLDFGGGWSANDRGGIHAVEWPAGLAKPSVVQTKTIFAEGFKKRQDLPTLLSHEDYRVRQRAQFELVERGEAKALLQVLSSPNKIQAKLHALWGLGQLHRSGKGDYLKEFISAASSPELELRVSACRILGDLRSPAAVTVLQQCLKDQARRVQSHAAIALGKLKSKESAAPLWSALQKNEAAKDRFLRIAIVNALVAIGDEAGAVSHIKAAERELRLGAVLVLRGLKSSKVAGFLQDSDKVVKESAIQAIYDNRLVDVYEEVMKLTDKSTDFSLTNRRRIMVINYLKGGVAGAKGVMRMVNNPKNDAPVREQGLALLSRWNDLPEFDLINNDHAPLPDRNESIYPGIQPELSWFLDNEKSKLLAKGTDLAKQLGMQSSGKSLLDQALNTALDLDSRIAAINALSANKQEFSDALPKLSQLSEDKIKATLLDLHFTMKLDGRQALAESALSSKSPERIRVAVKHLLREPDAVSRFEKLWASRATSLPAATHLDLFLGLQGSEHAALKQLASTFGADPSKVHSLTLEGGDAARGEVVFRGAGACVQCHMVDNRGGIQGPALDGVGLRQTRAVLLESVIQPGAKIAEGYGTMTITTKSGEIIAGLLSAEKNGSIDVLLPNNETKTIAVADIAKRDGPISSMPPIGAILPPTDLRDLIEYLSQRQAKDSGQKGAHGGK